jgi:hypothetical protein
MLQLCNAANPRTAATARYASESRAPSCPGMVEIEQFLSGSGSRWISSLPSIFEGCAVKAGLLKYYILIPLKLARYFTIIYILRGCRWDGVPVVGGGVGAGGRGCRWVPVGKAVERGARSPLCYQGVFSLTLAFSILLDRNGL